MPTALKMGQTSGVQGKASKHMPKPKISIATVQKKKKNLYEYIVFLKN